ncbi:MAG: CRISPR-associated endonuclease Cas1 [Deltaproteobacteria bacterium]|nr:CRISPR-associated endonuclease Cas1 [Deltaproteobacteria bacterium]
MDTPPDDPVPARKLAKLVFCPRSFWLEVVAGEWDESAETLAGTRAHKRVDRGGRPLPEPDALPDELASLRSVEVAAPEEGLSCRTDVLEVDDGAVVPVEYKRGDAPGEERASGGVWPSDRVQVGAQSLALRARGYEVTRAVVWYAGSCRRVEVPIDDALVDEVRATVHEARRVRALTIAPPPLDDSPKCHRCSLAAVCLPDETRLLQHLSASEAPDEVSLEAAEATATTGGAAPETVSVSRGAKVPVRRLVPAVDERLPLYLTTQGATVHRRGECLEVRSPEGETSTVRLREVSQVVVLGSVQLSPAVLQELCSRGIPVSLCSSHGWFYGTVGNLAEKNVHLRVAQFATAADRALRLPFARSFVEGKILNARTLLRRNGGEDMLPTLDALRGLAQKASRSADEESLLGVEGTAAALYFERFGALLAPPEDGDGAFGFDERNRRPPRDPVNAMLSFGYAMLTREVKVALASVGLDPLVGLFHRLRPGRASLALDLMEEFRPLVVDSVVLLAVNTGELRAGHFRRSAGACSLTDDGRRTFIAAYERRMTTEVRHPIFRYAVSYRRVLEVQARLLGRALSGEVPAYPPFRTR